MTKPNKKATDMTTKELAAYIDQSVLKPEFTEADTHRYIQEGVDFGCATVCINPSSLPIAAEKSIPGFLKLTLPFCSVAVLLLVQMF